jgi:hypothetical protein
MVIKHKDIEPTAEQRRQIINSFSPIIANWSANNKGDLDWPTHFDQHFKFYWREMGLQLIPDDAEIGMHVVEWLDHAFADRLRFVSQIGTTPKNFDGQLVARVVLNQVLALVNDEPTDLTPKMGALMTEREKDKAITALMGAIHQWQRDAEYREGKMHELRKGQIEHCLEKQFRPYFPSLHSDLRERIGEYVQLWIVLPFTQRDHFCGIMYPAETLTEHNIAEVVAITVINRTLAFLNDQPTQLTEESFKP